MSAFSIQSLIDGRRLPLLLKAGDVGQSLDEALPMLRAIIDRHLTDCGGIVFRDFSLSGPDAFRVFAAGFGHPLLTYEFGSTPGRDDRRATPDALKGSAFGTFNLVTGMVVLIGNTAAGWAWQSLGSKTPFLIGAGLSLLAMLLLALGTSRRRGDLTAG